MAQEGEEEAALRCTICWGEGEGPRGLADLLLDDACRCATGWHLRQGPAGIRAGRRASPHAGTHPPLPPQLISQTHCHPTPPLLPRSCLHRWQLLKVLDGQEPTHCPTCLGPFNVPQQAWDALVAAGGVDAGERQQVVQVGQQQVLPNLPMLPQLALAAAAGGEGEEDVQLQWQRTAVRLQQAAWDGAAQLLQLGEAALQQGNAAQLLLVILEASWRELAWVGRMIAQHPQQAHAEPEALQTFLVTARQLRQLFATLEQPGRVAELMQLERQFEQLLQRAGEQRGLPGLLRVLLCPVQRFTVWTLEALGPLSLYLLTALRSGCWFGLTLLSFLDSSQVPAIQPPQPPPLLRLLPGACETAVILAAVACTERCMLGSWSAVWQRGRSGRSVRRAAPWFGLLALFAALRWCMDAERGALGAPHRQPLLAAAVDDLTSASYLGTCMSVSYWPSQLRLARWFASAYWAMAQDACHSPLPAAWVKLICKLPAALGCWLVQVWVAQAAEDHAQAAMAASCLAALQQRPWAMQYFAEVLDAATVPWSAVRLALLPPQ